VFSSFARCEGSGGIPEPSLRLPPGSGQHDAHAASGLRLFHRNLLETPEEFIIIVKSLKTKLSFWKLQDFCAIAWNVSWWISVTVKDQISLLFFKTKAAEALCTYCIVTAPTAENSKHFHPFYYHKVPKVSGPVLHVSLVWYLGF